jgi:membrane protein YdbS with pleckstrin-like domain
MTAMVQYAIESWIVRTAGMILALAAIFRFTVVPVVRFGRRLERTMQAVEEQLLPNHGTSLRDAVTDLQKHFGITPKLPGPRLPPRE